MQLIFFTFYCSSSSIKKDLLSVLVVIFICLYNTCNLLFLLPIFIHFLKDKQWNYPLALFP